MLRQLLCCSALLGCGALAAVGSAAAQERNLNWAERMFSSLRHDFGHVARGADVRHQIEVTNIYLEDVTIANVGTTCGCTAAQPNKTLLKTHETALIEVRMDTQKFMRQKDSNVDVTLTFHGPQGTATKTVRIPISAYIRPDVVLTPGNADFGSVEYGQGGERVLDISYAGRSSWKIRDVRIGSEHLEANLREVSRGADRVSYQLSLRLLPDAPLGQLRNQIVLVTDDVNAPEVPVLVTGKVEPDIVVTPESYPLGRMTPGQVKPIPVVVKGKRPFTIESIECDGNSDCFEVASLSRESKNVHVLQLRFTAPDREGPFVETFTVTIAGRPQTVTFRTEGTIDAGF